MDERLFDVIPDDNSIWIMYDFEGREPYFKRFVTDKNVVTSLAIVSKKSVYLLVHTLDADNFEKFNGNLIVYHNKKQMVCFIEDIIKQLQYPENIYLNYSDKSGLQTDVLGHGTYMLLHSIVKTIYDNINLNFKFLSADNMICSLVESKTSEDIFFMQLSAKRALQIIENSFKKIKVGMTEKEIVSLFHKEFATKPDYFREYGVINETYAWEKNGCPIILVGPNLSKGGHSTATDEILQPGFTIYCDFGVILELANGKKYASDLQRMGYAIKERENIPTEVTEVFDTLVKSIRIGVSKFKPDVRGYEVDNAVRSNIIKNGYPNYNHSTGHPIGERAHDLGTSISPKGNSRSELLLKENGVYTIEPRIQMKNGGSIEEMVQVTKSGGKALCPMQEKLYIINQ